MPEGAQKPLDAQKETNIQREIARPPHGGDVYGDNIYGGSFNGVSVCGGNTSGCRIRGGGIRYDFSANIGPLGMPEGVKEALRRDIDCWDVYPDPYCRALTAELSAHTGIDGGRIVCGNGAADLIWRIMLALRPRKAVICAPTFSEYAKALAAVGSGIVEYRLAEENDFVLDEEILAYLDGTVQMLILCSPNNPTGSVIDPALLEKICEVCREKGILLLCDECFLDFVRDSRDRSAVWFIKCAGRRSVIVLKAFTKIYAMAGMRLGYALFGSRQLAETVRNTGQFWSVSSPAQAAGIAALAERDYVRRTVEIVETEREYLRRELTRLGLRVYPSEANFLLFRCGLPLDERLLKERILIRSCENYSGLDASYFRIAVRMHEENAALVEAIGCCLGI